MEKRFRITVKDDGTKPVVLDDEGRKLLGVVSVSVLGSKAFIKMAFRDASRGAGVFTVSPLFEDKYCAAIRHCDGAVTSNIGDIIMHEDGRYTLVVILPRRKERE